MEPNNHINLAECMDGIRAKYTGISSIDLRPEQIEIIESVLGKKTTFGFLPTGFGKSITYILPPLALDHVSIFN